MKKILFLTFLFVSCGSATQSVKLESFAFYDEAPQGYLYKAVTPEGIVLLISRKPNYPLKADNDFWKNALLKYLPEKGYKMIENSSTKLGKYFIFLIPGVKYDYFYFIHFQLKKDEIILTEIGGQYGHLKNYQKSILEFCDKEIITN